MNCRGDGAYRVGSICVIRCHGVLSLHAKPNTQIIPNAPKDGAARAADHVRVHGAHVLSRLLKRAFAIGVEHGPNCGGRSKIIATIDEPPHHTDSQVIPHASHGLSSRENR